MRNDALMKRTAILAALFAAASVSVMMVRLGTRTVLIADAAQSVAATVQSSAVSKLTIEKPAADASQDTLVISLPEHVNSDDIVMENHYMTRQLWVYVNSRDALSYYQHDALVSGLKQVIGGSCISQGNDGQVCLHIQLSGLYEYQSELSEKNITIRFQKPHEVYQKVVVIDPAGGGKQAGSTSAGLAEKEITLQIARKVNSLMKDPGTKIYFTRLDDSDPEASDRVKLAEDAQADMLIGITADGGGQNFSGIRSFYNDRFFIRGFGNADMAVQLERDCAYATGKTAEPVQAAGDEYDLLKVSEVPSAVLCIGNLKDAQDAADLNDSDYLNKIAHGIVQAIYYGGQVQK
ncbi:MAG: N-acetylmuramoyl-L-alanine amidase [Butyrivibrio sp.]|jgi:N-acetylmuramoyl-L-alanine amidase|nr:N-acetylmuramoyl-L-alanine amidase [Butyrivibrio sp.]